MKYTKTFEQYNKIDESLSKETVDGIIKLYDKARDGVYDWYNKGRVIFKGLKIINRLRKNYDLSNENQQKELRVQFNKELGEYVDHLKANHPSYEFKREMEKVLKEIKNLNKLTHDEFDKDPSRFSKHQQDVLINDLEITDDGIKWKDS